MRAAVSSAAGAEGMVTHDAISGDLHYHFLV